jgi:ABC-2 type transport system permease protein
MTDQPMNSIQAAPPQTVPAERSVSLGATLPFWAVFKRELNVYFRSLIAYAVAFGVLLFLGVLFTDYIAFAQSSLQQAQQTGGGGVPATPIIQQMPGLLTFLMFLIAPLLTMRLIAEESREGTLETLMTLPMGEAQFIVGKFLAAWAYYTVLLLLTLVHVVIVAQIGTPDWGVILSMYLGAWLYGGACLAIAMIWSAVTEDQIVSAFLSAATILVLYLAENFSNSLREQPNLAGLAEVVRELGLQAHFGSTLIQGIIRLEDILYFVFMIVGALFITTRIVETRRWRA